jgi:hypothetical protein
MALSSNSQCRRLCINRPMHGEVGCSSEGMPDREIVEHTYICKLYGLDRNPVLYSVPALLDAPSIACSAKKKKKKKKKAIHPIKFESSTLH